jgi:hypothetical protein
MGVRKVLKSIRGGYAAMTFAHPAPLALLFLSCAHVVLRAQFDPKN